jgi:DNA-binding NtrC family response regulator
MSRVGTKLKVLYGEGDTEVLAVQAAAVERAGHSVEQALGRKAVLEALKKGQFDLVVLGQTLTRNDRHHLVYMVKKTATATRVLVLHADGSRHPYVDGCTDTGATLETVLAKIAEVMGQEPPTAQAAAAAGG